MLNFVSVARTRAIVAAAVAVLAAVAALIIALPSAQAAPGPLRPLNLPGVCNGTSLALATAIDDKLKADGSPLRMIQADEPKKGETGYSDGTVAYAYLRLAALLGKQPGQLTENDIKNNPRLVQQAIDDALTYRRVNMRGDFTLAYTDSAGNKVILWCLKPNAKHGGPDLGLLYVPNGKTNADGVWIAGCVLAGGMNTYQFSIDNRTKVFTQFVWYNIGPDPNNANRYIRYVYTFDVATNTLTIRKEEGPIRNGVPQRPDKTETERNPGAPPAEFGDLKLNGVQISLLDADSAIPARTVVTAAVDPITRTTASLVNEALTDAVALLGTDVTFEPGDTFIVSMPEGTVAAAGGGNPYWMLLTPGEPAALFQYNGPEPITIGIGETIADVAMLAPAPPTSTSPPPSSTTTTIPTSTTSPSTTVPAAR
jgi:hypothetical protein